MSIFSDLLEQYIKEKDIKIYNLAAICQMDRSMLYRIISGKRNPPTLEIFQRIADNLQLAPAEYENLKSAYELTMLGETIYYRRKDSRLPEYRKNDVPGVLYEKFICV